MSTKVRHGEKRKVRFHETWYPISTHRGRTEKRQWAIYIRSGRLSESLRYKNPILSTKDDLNWLRNPNSNTNLPETKASRQQYS